MAFFRFFKNFLWVTLSSYRKLDTYYNNWKGVRQGLSWYAQHSLGIIVNLEVSFFLSIIPSLCLTSACFVAVGDQYNTSKEKNSFQCICLHETVNFVNLMFGIRFLWPLSIICEPGFWTVWKTLGSSGEFMCNRVIMQLNFFPWTQGELLGMLKGTREASGHGTKWLNSMGEIWRVCSETDTSTLFLGQNTQPNVFGAHW